MLFSVGVKSDSLYNSVRLLALGAHLVSLWQRNCYSHGRSDRDTYGDADICNIVHVAVTMTSGQIDQVCTDLKYPDRLIRAYGPIRHGVSLSRADSVSLTFLLLRCLDPLVGCAWGRDG